MVVLPVRGGINEGRIGKKIGMNIALTQQQARIEAERCLQCFDAPCEQAVPTHIKFQLLSVWSAAATSLEHQKLWEHLMHWWMCAVKLSGRDILSSVCTRSKQDDPIKIRELHFFCTQEEAEARFCSTLPFPKSRRKLLLWSGTIKDSDVHLISELGYQVLFEGKQGGVRVKSIPAFRLADKELESDTKFLIKNFSFKRNDNGNASVRSRNLIMRRFCSWAWKDRHVEFLGKTEGVLPFWISLNLLRWIQEMKVGKMLVLSAANVRSIRGNSKTIRCGKCHSYTIA